MLEKEEQQVGGVLGRDELDVDELPMHHDVSGQEVGYGLRGPLSLHCTGSI